jgi:hypothetical protein
MVRFRIPLDAPNPERLVDKALQRVALMSEWKEKDWYDFLPGHMSKRRLDFFARQARFLTIWKKHKRLLLPQLEAQFAHVKNTRRVKRYD